MKKKANYYGETHFSGYSRGKKHLSDYKSKNKKTQEKSAMRRHAKEVHKDKKVDYEMTVMKSFKDDPLGRQVYESILIVDSQKLDDFPMNNKNEFNQALIVTAKFTRGINN